MRIRKMTLTMLSLMVMIVLSAAANAEDVRYTTHIQKIFEQKCSGCHGQHAAPEYDAFKAEKAQWLGKGQGMRMDTYSHLIFYTAWPDTGSLMRRLDDGKKAKEGKPGNMYQHLGSTEEERQTNLNIFKAWVGNWTLKRWNEITKEEMNGIKVKY